MAVRELIDKLNCEKKLSHDEWVKLIKEYDEGDRAYAAELARGISQEMFGKDIYITSTASASLSKIKFPLVASCWMASLIR